VLDKRGGLAASVETLAELLGAAGYATHAAVANANGGAAFGNDQGFDEFVALYDSAERPAGAVTRAEAALVVFEGWLERADAAARNFYYLHVLEPHAPYDPPAPYKARWIDARYAGPFAAGDVAPLVDAAHGKLEVGAEDVRAARDLYDANLAYADEVLGALLDLLRERGLYERALIVVTSDHGEAFWEHGAWGHNTQLYEEMVRVPLVAKLPRGAAGPPPGTRVEGLTSNLDVLPSICAWLGLASPAGIAGRAITSGGAFADADELRSLWMSTNTKKQPDVALRWRGGKAVFRCNPDTGAWLAIEWYEHAGDPGERRDLAAGRRVELDELGARASAEQRGLQRARAATHAAWSARFTAADERLLEHIGYVEDDGEPAAEPPDEPLGE
jgi:arylsulfatase A-like enzyme